MEVEIVQVRKWKDRAGVEEVAALEVVKIYPVTAVSGVDDVLVAEVEMEEVSGIG